MTNLLPADKQNDVRLFYSLRRRTVAASVAIVSAMLSLLALAPSFLLLRVEQPSSQTETVLQNEKDDTTAISHAQELLAALSPIVAASSSVSEALNAALALRQKYGSITIDHISYQSGARGTIVLSGAATESRHIDAYRRALSLDPHFTDVSVPIGALIGARNGSFSITLSGSF
jgi:hypothetical protein